MKQQSLKLYRTDTDTINNVLVTVSYYTNGARKYQFSPSVTQREADKLIAEFHRTF